MAMKLPGRRIMTFGKDNAVGDSDFGLAVHAGVQWLVRDGHKLLPASELQVTGLHNAENALAALALCSAIDLPETEQLRALKGFKGLAHRMEKVLDVGGVGFYDDSKGTNVGATVAALNGMDRKVVLIAGGDGKGQDFKPLEEPVMNHAQAVVLIGRDGSRIGQALARTSIPLIYAQSMEQAVNHAFDQARPGDAVLLSPACASFDMFQNYVHRAQVFIRAVHLLAQKRNGHKQSCKVP
jgi:UDP-N-acetylmuramoylalanine--D-glutamate ligase